MSKFFGPSQLQDAPFIKFMFSNTKMAWLWLVVRVYVGYQWVNASLHKLSAPEWMQTGDALKGYWMHAVSIPEAPAKPPINFEWYRSFIQSMLDSQTYVWFAKLIAIGEFVVGIALIIGLFVGLAAFFGGVMNLQFPSCRVPEFWSCPADPGNPAGGRLEDRGAPGSQLLYSQAFRHLLAAGSGFEKK